MADILGRTPQFVRNLLEDRILLGHRMGAGRRKTYQIHRDCLVVYLAETANYHPGDFAQRLARLVGRCGPTELELVERATERRRNQLWLPKRRA